eukprot:15460336-Alexandrium_andersonii.AAC.1
MQVVPDALPGLPGRAPPMKRPRGSASVHPASTRTAFGSTQESLGGFRRTAQPHQARAARPMGCGRPGAPQALAVAPR